MIGGVFWAQTYLGDLDQGNWTYGLEEGGFLAGSKADRTGKPRAPPAPYFQSFRSAGLKTAPPKKPAESFQKSLVEAYLDLESM